MFKFKKRFLSAVLTLALLVGTVPAALFKTAAEASYNESPSWIKIGNHKNENGEALKADDKFWYNRLTQYLQSFDKEDKYIQLQTDINIDNNTYEEKDYASNISVRGNTVLDLNGKKLNIKVYSHTKKYGGEAYSNHYTLFKIEKGASLTIVDSTRGGKIFANTWILDPNDMNAVTTVVNMFQVQDGGELIINASGAEFECGRSKKQWMYSAACNGTDENNFDGYARGQANGTLITAEKGSNVKILGGKLMGRGYSYASYKGWRAADQPKKCAVVEAAAGSNIEVVDGTFEGMGGADIFQASKNANITVRGGTFNVSKVDKVVIEAYADQETGTWGAFDKLTAHNYMPGRYGNIGIPNSAIDFGVTEVISGGEAVTEDDGDMRGSEKTVVRPKTDAKYAGDTVKPYVKTGSDSWNPEHNPNLTVFAEYDPYYSEADAAYINEKDYQPDTKYTRKWYFTVINSSTGENVSDVLEFDAADYNGSDGKCEFKDLKKKGAAITDWAPGIYKLKMQVEEKWLGQNTYTRSYFNYYSFKVTDSAISKLVGKTDFEVKTLPTVAGENQEFSVKPTEATLKLLEDNGIKDTAGVEYSYYYYYSDDNGNTARSEDIKFTINGKATQTWQFSAKAAGPIVLTLKLLLPDGAGGFDAVTVTKHAFSMPSVSVWRAGLDSKYYYPNRNDTVDALGKNFVDLNQNLDSISRLNVNDPADGAAFNISDLVWEYKSPGAEEYTAVPSSMISKTGHIKTDRTALYRAKYFWNGKYWYSPNAIYVKAINYENNRAPYITGVESTTFGKTDDEGNKANILTVNLNTNAEWYEVTKYQLTLKSYPSGAKIGNSTITKYIASTYTPSQFNTDDFFSTGTNLENIVPGDYVFQATVTCQDSTGTLYYPKSELFTVRYEKKATNYYLVANGDVVYDPAVGDEFKQPYYTVPHGTGKINFSTSIYPSNATIGIVDGCTAEWESSDPNVISIDSVTGVATVLRPGTAKISVSFYYGEAIVGTTRATVVIPIDGFELEKPNYANTAGKYYYSQVLPKVKSVWAAGGIKVTENVDKYISVEVSSDTLPGSKIAYNDKVKVTYKIRANEGYRLRLRQVEKDGSIGYYIPDESLIETNGFGDTVTTAEKLGALPASGNSKAQIGYRNNGYYFEQDLDATYLQISDTVHIADPDTFYIETLSITTSKPVVGDSRYLGTNPDGSEFLKVEATSTAAIDGILGKKAVNTSISWVSKLDTIEGNGIPYDNAEQDFSNEWSTVGGANTKLRYVSGIYIHRLRLAARETDSTGKKYLFAPNTKIFVNGNLIEYASTEYLNEGKDSYLDFTYYFDVGEVQSLSALTLQGIETPRAGNIPTTAEEISIAETNDRYVSKLVWFIDENGNGQYDAGEECKIARDKDGNYDPKNSTMANGGRFLPNKNYCFYVEISGNGNTRLAETYTVLLNKDGTLAPVATCKATETSVSFTGYERTKISRFETELVDDLATAYYYKFKFYPQNDIDGYSPSSYWVEGEKDANGASSLYGEKYKFVVEYTAAEGNTFDNGLEAYVEGKRLTSGVEVLENGKKLKITYEFAISIKGDVNLDGFVDILDLIRLKKNLADPFYNESAADMNNDNSVDSIDLTLLRQMLLTQ